MARSLVIAAALLALVATPAHGARSTPVREVASAAVQDGEDQWTLASDGRRYVSYVLAGTRTARVHDTATGATFDVPDCRLLVGSNGLFVAACGERFHAYGGGKHFLDARTRQLFPIRGQLPGDAFDAIGEHWVRGADTTPCPTFNCSEVTVYVNRKTGRRVDCFSESEGACDGRIDMSTPSGRWRKHSRMLLAREEAGVILRERGRRDRRLSSRGACTQGADYCDATLSSGHVTWSEPDRANGRRAHVFGFDLRTERRAAWKVPRAWACPGERGELHARVVHTRHEVWFAGLFPAYPSEACRSAPVYAARWPR
ncbi:MAG TPA: hypothetical protein VHF45_12055 [Thermoleophilaceae bacterium]|nr:hypothetical protein [Thermoleophilaceae bacterium]